MSASHNTSKAIRVRTNAFTLIELLVVIGLIAVLSGGVGLALQDGSENALSSAQLTLAGLTGAARAQAALHQTEARLLIYGEPPPSGDPDKFLRVLQVVRADPAGSNKWHAVGGSVTLPRGVFVVPGASASASSLGSANFNPVLEESSFGAAYWLEFTAEGSFTSSGGAATASTLVLTVGRMEAGDVKFAQPERSRAIRVGRSGVLSFLNSAEGIER